MNHIEHADSDIPAPPIEILLAGSADQIPYGMVTARSVLDRTRSAVRLHFFYAYPETVGDENGLSDLLARATDMVAQYPGASITFVDVSGQLPLFDGQWLAWHKHYGAYLYLLPPVLLPGVDKIIYFDTDIIVNTDVAEIWNIELGDQAIAVAFEHGHAVRDGKNQHDHSRDNVTNFNAGFFIINVAKWRRDNLFDKLMALGRSGEPQKKYGNYSDNALMCAWFLDHDFDNLKIIDWRYNALPLYARNDEKPHWDAAVFHFCGIAGKHDRFARQYPEKFRPTNFKPWVNKNNFYLHDRWWHHTRHTPFYEKFIFDVLKRETDAIKNNQRTVGEKLQKENLLLAARLEDLSRQLMGVHKILPNWLGRAICCFIFKSKNRKRFRAKYVKGCQ